MPNRRAPPDLLTVRPRTVPAGTWPHLRSGARASRDRDDLAGLAGLAGLAEARLRRGGHWVRVCLTPSARAAPTWRPPRSNQHGWTRRLAARPLDCPRANPNTGRRALPARVLSVGGSVWRWVRGARPWLAMWVWGSSARRCMPTIADLCTHAVLVAPVGVGGLARCGHGSSPSGHGR